MRNFEQSDHVNWWNDRDVEAHWDRVATIYVAENNKVKTAHDQRFTESMQHLHLENARRVLNVTSRDAEADDFIRKHNPTSVIVNAEISSGLMAEAAKIRPLIIQKKIETYSSLPFEDQYFDRVLSLETLEHAADPLAFLKEMHRVSKQHARLVLSCPPATSEIPYQIFTALFGGHGEGPHRFLPSKEVKVMLKKAGWKLLIHKGTVLIPVGPQWLQGFGERLINAFQGSLLAELGIRQFFVCEKY
ncbi:MAG: class I SAM-dependent methyltransferase [Bacteroidetes bacterium]|nr:class I SAM-dependent methyltransferase [Bacteroidota bacterium]MBU1580844.1 class I SAM-dependent methyltransferase [Bacteroidota bacterium]MBU2558394.1 class I SAM-dependent methyltransferase [Bacteroidota bacterium]